MDDYTFEKIGGGVEVCVSPQHTFGTDAFLLSYFATPKRKDTVCDLGTGCGIVPFLWMRDWATRPQKAYGLDIQPEALAQLNLSRQRSDNLENFHPLLGDLREIETLLPSGEMDLVTFNPPYNTPGSGVMSQTASDQIARHETLCTTRDLVKAAAWLLRFGGRLCVCQLPERLVDVLETMRQGGIEPKRLRMVQQSFDAKPWLVLVEGKRGAKPFLQIDPPLILKVNGKTSPEMDKIYGMYGKVQ